MLIRLSEEMALLESLTKRHSGLMENPSLYFNNNFKIRPGREEWVGLLRLLASQIDEMIHYISKMSRS